MNSEHKQMLKSRIRDNLNSVAQEIGFEGTDEDLDALTDMVFDEEESFTMTFIAENHQESRLFTRKCEPSTWFGSKKDASNYDEVGSDDCFSSLAIMYREDLNIEYDSDPYSAEEREQDRQATLSALKDVVGDDVNGMSDDYVFPDIQVV